MQLILGGFSGTRHETMWLSSKMTLVRRFIEKGIQIFDFCYQICQAYNNSWFENSQNCFKFNIS